jgi:hypothetical protein
MHHDVDASPAAGAEVAGDAWLDTQPHQPDAGPAHSERRREPAHSSPLDDSRGNDEIAPARQSDANNQRDAL